MGKLQRSFAPWILLLLFGALSFSAAADSPFVTSFVVGPEPAVAAIPFDDTYGVVGSCETGELFVFDFDGDVELVGSTVYEDLGSTLRGLAFFPESHEAVMTTSDGRVFTCVPYSLQDNAVEIFNSSLLSFTEPAIDDDNRIFVPERNDRVLYRITAEGIATVLGSVGTEPRHVALDLDSDLAVVTNSGDGTLTLMHPETGFVYCTFAVPGGVWDVEILADDDIALVTCPLTGELVSVDVSDPLSPRIVETILLGDGASDLHVRPDQHSAFITCTGAGTIVSVDITNAAKPVRIRSESTSDYGTNPTRFVTTDTAANYASRGLVTMANDGISPGETVIIIPEEMLFVGGAGGGYGYGGYYCPCEWKEICVTIWLVKPTTAGAKGGTSLTAADLTDEIQDMVDLWAKLCIRLVPEVKNCTARDALFDQGANGEVSMKTWGGLNWSGNSEITRLLSTCKDDECINVYYVGVLYSTFNAATGNYYGSPSRGLGYAPPGGNNYYRDSETAMGRHYPGGTAFVGDSRGSSTLRHELGHIFGLEGFQGAQQRPDNAMNEPTTEDADELEAWQCKQVYESLGFKQFAK